jgi:hypothetical protein
VVVGRGAGEAAGVGVALAEGVAAVAERVEREPVLRGAGEPEQLVEQVLVLFPGRLGRCCGGECVSVMTPALARNLPALSRASISRKPRNQLTAVDAAAISA